MQFKNRNLGAMERKRPSSPPPNSLRADFIDIHEVLHEDATEQEPEKEQETTRTDKRVTCHRGGYRPIRARPQHRSFSRQVSLETGFSVLSRESRRRDEKKALPRSGRSFAGFESGARINGGGDARKADFSIFRTKSTLSKQNSLLPSARKERDVENSVRTEDGEPNGLDESINASVPAGRYFAALRGPELDEVKEHEDILLPKEEKWPFLLRFPIGCFGISLGLSSQAVLWLALAKSPATSFLHITPLINLSIWLLSLIALVSISFTYILKCIFYFEAVKREYCHPVRVNFFFAPWVVCMFLAISVPPLFSSHQKALHPVIWCAFMGPYFFLELKIYGQWLSGGKRRLCKVANPSSHLSVVGNFVGAILASKVGWNEAAKFLWAVGFAHYLVVFVTLYQRLPTSEALPKELHPVYSMFIAAPSAASIAWETIYGKFDGCSRTCFFIALFLYISLVIRINFFTGFRFSVAWWSYTFPMTTASVATIKYAEQVPGPLSKGLALVLSFMSSTMVAILFISTLLHAFVWRDLFPNDLAIAITKRRLTREKKSFKRVYDLKRWTKQALTKRTSADKEFEGEEESHH
ncbi:PREDICTED: guard cell S-type anion channel SLAC1 [Tarenaya hassleriana]|uniref:guard cell S-type anion channel SLAC1 n=1 Tax=Tarenaya hassleriana TaxID=28532 RepID=UPI0008FD52E8|nr:PREDICTED: guard cell S-type anion channel SLAC1 [Tarenaya hassleriana]